MFQKKIKYRISNKTMDRWVHFCYVSQELKNEFDVEVNSLNQTSNYWIMKWANEDFGMRKINTLKDLNELRRNIKNMYRDKYPEIYIESSTDQQGWVRVWYTHHMEREIRNVKG